MSACNFAVGGFIVSSIASMFVDPIRGLWQGDAGSASRPPFQHFSLTRPRHHNREICRRRRLQRQAEIRQTVDMLNKAQEKKRQLAESQARQGGASKSED